MLIHQGTAVIPFCKMVGLKTRSLTGKQKDVIPDNGNLLPNVQAVSFVNGGFERKR